MYLLGIDFGGGASKATLIDEKGKLVADSSQLYPTLYPAPGCCEQEPNDWFEALCGNCRAVISTSGIDPRHIAGVAIDSATHTAVLCDGDMKPLRNPIHWTDSRSRDESRLLREEHGELIFAATNHSPDTIWTLPQLLWLSKNEPELYKKIKHILFEKDYIRYLLTGEFMTDHIEAQGSMLYDCRSSSWSPELCALAQVDSNCLPPLVKPGDIAGYVTPAAASATGLAAGTPVICGTTDTCMEIFASGAVGKGDMTVKLATAGRICVITDRAYPHRHLVNYSHIVPGLWYPGTATKACAASFRWYRESFGGDNRSLDAEAENIAVGSDGLFYHPYLNGELTPYADPTLCGSFVGIRAFHTKAHFTRAVLEGVSLSLLDCLGTLREIGICSDIGEKTATLIGGGSKSSLWRRITSDALGIRLRTCKSSDSSLGSAMLAGISLGVFASPADAVASCIRFDTLTEPVAGNTAKYAECFTRYKKIHDALAPYYNSCGTI